MAENKLVIVESPAKAKTISKYLGDGFTVLASVGHIRDLAEPSALPAEAKKGYMKQFAIDIENNFEPYYLINAGRKSAVADLKKALAGADELYLATDEDREGEAIAWHLLQVLKPKVPVKRMVFHEITKDAILESLKNTRAIDENLVRAQETRRIVDRLYGYEISPVLWRKINRGLSAGRVQSPAMRLVVERERERMAFVSASYFDVKALLDPRTGNDPSFEAKLLSVDGKRIATGESFDDKGVMKLGVLLLDEASSNALAKAVKTATIEVVSVEAKPSTRRPAAPFTTSTLQQEASRKLRLSAKQTMDLAQSLYQDGHITYMRTDSPTLSGQAISAARSQVKSMFGADYLPDAPRVYTGKSKGAQEAHEAIRPSGEVFKTPSELASVLYGRALELYDLIWKRTVASQMLDAKVSTTTAKLRAKLAEPIAGVGSELEFTASGTVVVFAGFMAAYEEGRDDEAGEDQERESKLPKLEVGQKVQAVEVTAKDHQTSPPARYTEASLVKALEEDGIGRPSTYASILSTIINKGYVTKRGQALVPEWIAFTVTRFLENNFDYLIDYEFTASMEQDLDQIAEGKLDSVNWLKDFFFGDDEHPGLTATAQNILEQDNRAINSFELAEGLTLRTGKYGPYLEIRGEPGEPGVDETGRRIINIPEGLAPDELTTARAKELIEAPVVTDKVLGVDPATGFEILFKDGRYGPYVVLNEPDAKKPKTASLFKSMDPAAVTLEDALQLLSLPREVGVDPEDGKVITAQNGPYGPYLKKGNDSRQLTTEQQIFEITLDEAVALYKLPKTRGRQAAANARLKEFAADPASGTPVLVKTGQFGTYVTDGFVNATLPKDEPVEELSADRAYELLAIRREKLSLAPGETLAKTKRPGRRAPTGGAKRATKAKKK